MAYRSEERARGGEPAFEILPGADGSFAFSRNGREVTERCELSPEGQAQKRMIEETYRRLTGQEPPQSE